MPTVVGAMTRGAAFNYVVELNALGASAPTPVTIASDRIALTAYTSTYLVDGAGSANDDIDGISGWNENMFIMLRAATGRTHTLKDENAGAASTSDRIRLPGGADVSFTDDEVVFLWHDDTLDRWILISGPSTGDHVHTGTGDGGGTIQPDLFKFPVPTVLTIAAGAVTFTQSYHILSGEGGSPDDLSSITAGTAGQTCLVEYDYATAITIKDDGAIRLVNTYEAPLEIVLGVDAFQLFFVWSSAQNVWMVWDLGKQRRIVSPDNLQAVEATDAGIFIGENDAAPSYGIFVNNDGSEIELNSSLVTFGTTGTLAEVFDLRVNNTLLLPFTQRTIASGSITSAPVVRLIPQGGSPGTDDLTDMIYFQGNGETTFLGLNDGADTITLKHAAGATGTQLYLANERDVVLTEREQTVSFIYDDDLFGGNGGWKEMLRSMHHTPLVTAVLDSTVVSTTVPYTVIGPMQFSGIIQAAYAKTGSNKTCGATAGIFDVHKILSAAANTDGQGTTIFSTRPQINNTEMFDNSAVISVTTFALGDWFAFYMDQAGTTLTDVTVSLDVRAD